MTLTLEYCTQILNSNLAKDIDIHENVQRRATKLLTSISSLTYAGDKEVI